MQHCFFNSFLLRLQNKLHVFVARFTVTLLTVHRIAWYLINILTMFTVPCACLISCNVGCDLLVHKNILGAMIIATLLSPILLCFSWATTRLKKWTRIYEKTMVECVKSSKDFTKVCIVNLFSPNTISFFRFFFCKMLENEKYNVPLIRDSLRLIQDASNERRVLFFRVWMALIWKYHQRPFT